ncbi:MAG TPA: hypothetical protein VIL95_02600 [Bacillota bacterium]
MAQYGVARPVLEGKMAVQLDKAWEQGGIAEIDDACTLRTHIP